MSTIDPTSSTPALNVVLIGFMGCGKTTIGAKVAALLGFHFVDTDEIIVKKAGQSIPDIFARVGEEGFRAMETEVLRELCSQSRNVIATGGGIVTREENLPLLKQLGLCVWLSTTESVIYERVARNNDRPLLRQPNPRAVVHELLEARKPLYEAAADLKVETTGLTPDEAAYGVGESARVWFCDRGIVG